jgi:hypothetical protein
MGDRVKCRRVSGGEHGCEVGARRTFVLARICVGRVGGRLGGLLFVVVVENVENVENWR